MPIGRPGTAVDDEHQNRPLQTDSQHRVAPRPHVERARNLMWRGGALHLHDGGGSGSTEHTHFAIQVTIGLQCPILIRSRRNAPQRISGGWLIASNQSHCMQADGGHISVFLDPLSANGRRVRGRLGSAGVLALSLDESRAAEREFRSCLHEEWLSNDVRTTVDRVILLLTPGAIAVPELDFRVQRVVEELIADSSEQARAQVLAAMVRLSESRLAHLFSRDVGIPIRQYRLWLRIQKAIAQVASGRSLTESAHMAGFADSSHFCRICRRMFGSSPSGLPGIALEEDSL